jgi:hypothetical protein
MGSVISPVGLCFDVVGAGVLALIKRSHLLTWLGENRTPREYAHDLALAISGGLLLMIGFVFQWVAAFGYPHHRPRETVAYATVAVLLGGTLLAGVFYLAIRGPAERRETNRRFRKDAATPEAALHPLAE